MLEKFVSSSIPILIVVIIVAAIIEKKDVLKLFTDGVVEGLRTQVTIFPSILAIIVAITLATETGLFDYIIKPISPLLECIGVPSGIIPLSILRPLSGGSSMAVLMDIITKYGVDSTEGRIASIIMASSETTLYVITVFLGMVGIKKGGKVLVASLVADVVAVIAAIIVVNLNLF